MTILQPGFFLASLLALPVLVILYFWFRRPRPVHVPSIEVWQQVLARMPESAVRRARRRWPDPRLWLALLVLAALVLAAGDVSVTREGEQSREVRLVLDRSLWMKLPVVEAETPAWPLALARAADVAQALQAHDRLELVVVPPVAPGELDPTTLERLQAEEPAILADALRSAAQAIPQHEAPGGRGLTPTDTAAPGEMSAAVADALTWAEGAAKRRVVALTTQPLNAPAAAAGAEAASRQRFGGADEPELEHNLAEVSRAPRRTTSTPPSRLALVRWTLAPGVVHLRDVAVEEEEVLVELLAPAERVLTLEVHALDAQARPRPELEPVRRVLAAENRGAATANHHDAPNAEEQDEDEAPDAPFVRRRVVLPRPGASAGNATKAEGGILVRVAGAVPTSRVTLAQPLRVAVRLPVALADDAAQAWLDWLAALFPALEFERMPAEGEVELARPDVLLTASAGRLHEIEGLGTAPPPAWQDVPRLYLGPVPAPANPFVAEEVAPEPVRMTLRRRVEQPGHPLLDELELAQLVLHEAHRLEPGLGLSRFEVIFSAELADEDNENDERERGGAFTPLIAVAEEGPARGVLIAGSEPLLEWPRTGGWNEALLLGNAFTYLLGESARAALFEEDATAQLMQGTRAGEPFSLPAWAAWRREQGAPLAYAWQPLPDSVEGDAEHETEEQRWHDLEQLAAVSHHAGLVRVELPGKEQATVLARQAGRLDVASLQRAHPSALPATATELPPLATWLPSERSETVVPARAWWLLLALLAGLAYAYAAVRRRFTKRQQAVKLERVGDQTRL